MPSSIELSIEGVLTNAIGPQRGLSISQLQADYQQSAKQAYQWVWDRRYDMSAWLGWLNVTENTALIADIEHYAESIKGQFDQLVVVGIGGSALGPLAMAEALLPSYWNERSKEQRNGFPRLYFVDNVDPDKLMALLDVLDLKRTLINVVTKSGTTPETVSGFLWLKDHLKAAVGANAVAKHIVVTTDPAKGPLRTIAKQEGWTAFPIESNIGGRFSIFSPVGLLPAAILGIPIQELIAGLEGFMVQAQQADWQKNGPLLSAVVHYAFYQRQQTLSVLMPYSAKLAYVADWYVQLWAESLGKRVDKNNKEVFAGSTPIKAVGVTDQHSQVQLFNEGPHDKCVTFIRLGSFQQKQLTIPEAYPEQEALHYLGGHTFEALLQAEAEGTRASLMKNQRPSMTLTLPQLTPYYFAQLLFFLELQTAYMGYFLNIDPFDQPGVELGKQLTCGVLGRKGFEQFRDDVLKLSRLASPV